MQSFLDSVNKAKQSIQMSASAKAAIKNKLQAFMGASVPAQEEMLKELAVPATVSTPVETTVVARTEQTVK
jgi:hypothetical protein